MKDDFKIDKETRKKIISESEEVIGISLEHYESEENILNKEEYLEKLDKIDTNKKKKEKKCQKK